MKRRIKQLIFSFLLLIGAGAQADLFSDPDNCCLNTRVYGKFFGGANFLDSTLLNGNKSHYDTGYSVGSSLGYCLNYGLQLEGEYTYRKNSIKKIHFFGEGTANSGHLETSSYMANLLWGIPFSWECFSPFVGAGIGYDYQKMHASNPFINFRQSWSHFSWQLMAALSYSLTCNTKIALDYKFHHGGCHFYNHSVEVGLFYYFDFSR